MLSPREVPVSLSSIHGSCITECIYVAADALIVEFERPCCHVPDHSFSVEGVYIRSPLDPPGR